MVNETYLQKIVDLLFEIRNNQERTNELLEDLKNPVEPEKREIPMTRKEQRELRNKYINNGETVTFSGLPHMSYGDLVKVIIPDEPNGETGTHG
jgi:hypothetical protein